MDYLDFELRISGSGGEYSVAIVRSPAGESSSSLLLPFGETGLLDRLRAVQDSRGMHRPDGGDDPDTRALILSPQPPAQRESPAGAEPLVGVKNFGRELFESLLPSELRSCYRRSLDRAREQGKGLRLRLRCDAPELAALPWEFLYDEDEGRYVCLSNKTPLVRYPEVAQATQPLKIKPPLHILGMVASPGDLPRLDVEREKRQMEDAIQHLAEKGVMKLTWLEGQTARHLQSAIDDIEPHVFHFIGHGGFDLDAKEGVLAFSDNNGQAHRLSASKLGDLLQDCDSLRLVVLNSCEGARASVTNLFSSTGTVLIRRGIPAVVSMQYEITDRAAIELSRRFYDALTDGSPVDAALQEARKAISMALDDSVEWGTPVLDMRSPDGDLIEIDVQSAVFEGAPAVQASSMAPKPADAAPRPRQITVLLERMKNIWVEGVLQRSVEGGALMDLGMEVMRGVDQDQLNCESYQQDLGAFFAKPGGSLLVLGDPGAGKSTTLLVLARDLIARAERSAGRSVPVVLNLASWDGQPLFDWSVEQIRDRYYMPRDFVEAWLKDNWLILLLDGLDEVRADCRAACVEAINAFAPEVGLAGIAVCSRFKEYIELPVRLGLTAAVRLSSLSHDQVLQYVVGLGEEFKPLQKVLEEDSAFQILARSPLMLGLMIQVYRDRTMAVARRESSTSAERRKQLMAAYVDCMFARQRGDERA